MFHVLCTNQMHKVNYKDQQMHFYVQHSIESYSRQQLLTSNIIILIIILTFNHYFKQKYVVFNCRVISTHYKYMCNFVLTSLKMATWLAKTCQWSLCKKNYIHTSKCICWYFNQFYAFQTC
jgi:hypothetical protein